MNDRKRTWQKRLAAACAALLLAGAAVCGAGTSVRVRAADGLWYYNDYAIESVHAQGIDGTGVHFADIDTMINPHVPWLSDANLILTERNITQFYGDISPVTESFDRAFHATDMLSVLQGNGQGAGVGQAPHGIIPGATIHLYPAVTSEDDAVTGGDIYDVALQMALADGVDVISIPAGGRSYYDRQFPYVYQALQQGVPMFIAHANALSRIDAYTRPEVYRHADGSEVPFEALPSADPKDEICYWPGMVTVQCLNAGYAVHYESRITDSGVDLAAPGEDIYMEFYTWGHFEPHGGGCSAATTLAAGYFTLAMQKWPRATGNQLLQLMVHTTMLNAGSLSQSLACAREGDLEGMTNELQVDPYTGYGVIRLDLMLETDPVLFPDVNPILYRDVEQAVKNALAREDREALRDEELLRIAGLLLAQIQEAGCRIPSFLTTVFGEIRTEAEAPAAEAEASRETPAGEAQSATTSGPATMPASPTTAQDATPAHPEKTTDDPTPGEPSQTPTSSRFTFLYIGGILLLAVMLLLAVVIVAKRKRDG